MTPLSVTPNLELDGWPECTAENLPHNAGGETAKLERVGILPNATANGKAAVEFLIRMPDGTLLVAETTLRLFLVASSMVAAAPVTALEDL